MTPYNKLANAIHAAAGPQPFLYLIHFDEPRHHAQHYLGSTLQLTTRLTAHANGTAARLTQVLWEDFDTWAVVALFVPRPGLCIRECESRAKRGHNSRRYCPICSPGKTVAPKGTISYPVPFGLTSQHLRKD